MGADVTIRADVTKRAYLVSDGTARADAVLGGLPILLRQALSLQDAGIEELVLVGVPAAALPRDRRLRLSVHEMAGAPIDVADHDAIVARAGCVWHPAIVRRLARTAIDADGRVTVGSPSAAVSLCGGRRVAAAIASLLPNAVTAQASPTGEALPPEFVVCPATAADRAAATRLLLRSLEKASDGLASRHVHRPLSRAVTNRLLAWPITPNAMTLVAAAWGAAGAWIAYRGGYWHLLLGALLFEVQNILDGCDGEIARLKYLRSRGGEWLDQILDDVLNTAFFAAVGFGLARGGARGMWSMTVVGLAAQAVHLAGLYAGLMWKAGGRGSVASLRWAVDGPGRRTIGDLTRRDFIALAYVVAAALNLVVVAFLWHAAVTCGAAIVTTLQWIARGGPEFRPDDAPLRDTA
jgi:phosphatidylglycerophosphate synthase